MAAIPDFNKNEMRIIHDTLKQRYGKDIEVQEVDTELRLNPHSSELTPCPAVYWQAGDAHLSWTKRGRGATAARSFTASASNSVLAWKSTTI